MYRVIFLSFFFVMASLPAAYLFKNGSFIDVKDMATLSVEEHYTLGVSALEKKEWQEAVHQFRIVTINFPLSSWANEAFYFLGVSYYHVGDYDLANRNFSTYLNENQNPQYFEESFQYKLAIADAFANGAKRHLFGYEKMPQWIGAEEVAISLYDEIMSSLPYHELAAKAILSKASYLSATGQFKESVEAYQTLIRKFPKSDFAAKGYTSISTAYLALANTDVHNPDILPLAEINLRRFSQEFPRDEEIETIKKQIQEMKEVFANALYETGRFYERKGQPKASVLYYHSAYTKYPDTQIALSCKKRLEELNTYAEEINLPSH